MQTALRTVLAPLLLATSASAQEASALYRVTFDATWSALTHPGAYPGGAHFSPLIGATHDATLSVWDAGGTATPGIEQMAETGATGSLTSEVNAAIALGSAGQVVAGGGADAPGTATAVFTASAEHPLVSLVTMIAPSPDWFVGVHDLDLRDGPVWRDELVVDLFAYDAGTDSGSNFTSGNANTVPQDPIALITAGPFFGTTPLGTFTFERLASTAEYGCGGNPGGSLAITSGPPTLGSQLVVELADPSGTMGLPSQTFLMVGSAPAPGFPCGVLVPDFGLDGVGTPGELLLADLLLLETGPAYAGTPAVLSLPIPTFPGLVGQAFYAQGILLDPTLRVGLTTATELVVGP